MKNTLSIDIEAPIQKVFDFIHDPEKHKLWLGELEETIYEPDYDPDRSHSARNSNRRSVKARDIQVYDGEVTAFHKPSHLGVRLSSKAFSVQVEYRLKGSKKATHLTFTSEFTFKSIAYRAMITLSRPLMMAILQRQLSKLKELTEAG